MHVFFLFLTINSRIKKEQFSSDKFDTKTFLNNYFNSKSSHESESDIFNFQLKIMHGEFNNDIEVNTNNLLKAPKLLEEDLKDISFLNNNLIQKINEIKKSNIEQENLEDLSRAGMLKIKNNNINKALSFLDKM